MLAANPYVIGVLVALLAAALAWVHARMTAKENAPAVAQEAFGRTALVGALAAGVVGYVVSARTADKIQTTPFEIVPTRPAAPATAI